MTDTRFDVLAIGNAIVDVISPCEDAFLQAEGLDKGAMALVDTARAEELYAHMGPAREISGGSAANTCAGLAALGSRTAFIGQVADDQLGAVFAHDIRAAGIHYEVAPRAGDPPTARCLVLVTPDGQRTMNTFLGASQHLPASAVDADLIASAKVLYLEGYLWDPDDPRAAMKGAIEAARKAGRQVAFTLSDAFLLDRHGDDFRKLIDDGLIDILFANEVELMGLTGAADFEAGLAALAPKLPVLVATRSEKGAVAVAGADRAEVPAEPVAKVVDTTGAGDSFAAGFLHGHVSGAPLADCLTMGAVAAAEVIGHYGARPEADLKELVAKRLG
ncbi:adenosine kinase [Croceicoccus sediminis]|uniref:adenosine kinase n=1 Tax=Croceicoccus sediminis TaxID=2571150 RepID=UPI0011842FAC|nr:adenosine kinase [Croceicoccus sediminis]